MAMMAPTEEPIIIVEPTDAAGALLGTVSEHSLYTSYDAVQH
jgi:hypothetical protein